MTILPPLLNPNIKDIIIGWKEASDGYVYFLHWDRVVKAPVSKVMNIDEFTEYVTLWELNSKTDPLGMREDYMTLVLGETDMHSREILNELMVDNRAGPNREGLFWTEIIKLYRE